MPFGKNGMEVVQIGSAYSCCSFQSDVDDLTIKTVVAYPGTHQLKVRFRHVFTQCFANMIGYLLGLIVFCPIEIVVGVGSDVLRSPVLSNGLQIGLLQLTAIGAFFEETINNFCLEAINFKEVIDGVVPGE